MSVKIISQYTYLSTPLSEACSALRLIGLINFKRTNHRAEPAAYREQIASLVPIIQIESNKINLHVLSEILVTYINIYQKRWAVVARERKIKTTVKNVCRNV